MCKQSIETVSEEDQTFDLLDKNFKWAILNMFKEQKETMSKKLKENVQKVIDTDLSMYYKSTD